MSGVVDRGRRTLERYWSILDADDELVDPLVASVFVSDAILSSAWLDEPVRGHGAIAAHLRDVRTTLEGMTVRRLTDVQFVDGTARWCWRTTGPNQTRRGMDVARLTGDGTWILELVVFDGLLPVPA